MKENKTRLDLLVAEKFSISRTLAKEYIQLGYIFFNNKILDKPNLKIDHNAELVLQKKDETKKKQELEAKPFELEIVYEDDYLLIVNKPSGIIVHPTSYLESDTLANYVKYYFNKNKIEEFENNMRCGIVHRLDKDTSGLLIIAKSKDVYDKFVELIKNKKVQRKYLALCHGYLKTKKVEVQAPIARIDETNRREVSNSFDAQDATSIFYELKRFNNFSLIECELITGRTHQIRVHLEYLKNNIVNDPLYGLKHLKQSKYGQYLVAYKISFNHPFINNKNVSVEINMPKEFENYIKKNGD